MYVCIYIYIQIYIYIDVSLAMQVVLGLGLGYVHVGRHCISMHVCTCVDHMMLYTRPEMYLLQCEVCSSALGLGYVHVGRHWLSVHVCMDSMSAGIVPTLSIHVCMDIHVCLMRYHTPGLRWMSCDASSACLRSYQDIRIGRCLHGPPSTFAFFRSISTHLIDVCRCVSVPVRVRYVGVCGMCRAVWRVACGVSTAGWRRLHVVLRLKLRRR
jgi:hypothetical protein